MGGGISFAYPKEAERAVIILEGWNMRADKEEAGMTIFYFWFRAYRKVGEPVTAFDEAVARLVECFGSVDVLWGDFHVISRGNMTLPLDGGDKLLPMLWMAGGETEGCRMTCTRGSSFTMLVFLRKGNVTAYTLLP